MHAPDDGKHVPARWHWSDAAHVTGFDPVHVPAWQVSVWVQASASSHTVPSAFAGLLHWPVSESQVPARWHWSDAAQVTGFDPVHVPAWQVSVWVQALPSSHAPVSVSVVVAVAELFAGFGSAVVDETEAVFKMTVPFPVHWFARNTIVKLAGELAGLLGVWQAIVPVPPTDGTEHDQPPGAVIDWKVVFAGIASVS